MCAFSAAEGNGEGSLPASDRFRNSLTCSATRQDRVLDVNLTSFLLLAKMRAIIVGRHGKNAEKLQTLWTEVRPPARTARLHHEEDDAMRGQSGLKEF